MGYYLQAIIGNRALLEEHVSDHASLALVALNFDLALIPLTDELFEEVGADGDVGGFYKLTPAVSEWIQAISTTGVVAYVEAEYFGGTGGQSATVWSRGQQVLVPTHKKRAINEALRLLGIKSSWQSDEFKVTGLKRHRNTEDWAGDALPFRSNR